MSKTVLFGRYRLLAPAGRGGSAQVWRAFDTRTKEQVAVKRLHPIVFADDAGRTRLKREFTALRALHEPHVVRVRDLHLGRDDGALVLDYVPGESLADRLTAGAPLPAAEAVAIAVDIAAALAAAHAAGIVHRDVTPGNILLDPSHEARLTDFGIAQGGDGATATVTADGELVGTLRFLAPEQLRGEPATPATDLHSLAAVTYEMLAGRPAYAAATPVALAEAQRRGAARIDGVSRLLDEAVRRGLATNPADRQESVTAFAEELVAALEDAETATFAIPGQPAAPALEAVSRGPAVAPAGGVGPAVPAAATGPLAEALVSVEPRPAMVPAAAGSQPARLRRRAVPAPLVALFALVLTAFALASLAPGTPSPAANADGRSLQPAFRHVTPTPDAREATPEPVPEKTDVVKGKGDGNGKGKGKGNND